MNNEKSLWKVFAENAFSQGKSGVVEPELARQIEERAQSEGHKDIAVVAICADEKAVTVRCDDDFGLRLNDLPGASYAEKAKTASLPRPLQK